MHNGLLFARGLQLTCTRVRFWRVEKNASSVTALKITKQNENSNETAMKRARIDKEVQGVAKLPVTMVETGSRFNSEVPRSPTLPYHSTRSFHVFVWSESR